MGGEIGLISRCTITSFKVPSALNNIKTQYMYNELVLIELWQIENENEKRSRYINPITTFRMKLNHQLSSPIQYLSRSYCCIIEQTTRLGGGGYYT